MRNRTHLASHIAAVATVAVAFLSSLAANVMADAPRSRSFEFEYRATVKDIPVGTTVVDLWIPVPHDTPYQTIRAFHVDSSYPYELENAEYGNRVLHIRVKNPKVPALSVTTRFEATRLEHLAEALNEPGAAPVRGQRDPDMKRWLEPDRLVPIDGKVKQWAQEVVDGAGAKTDLEKARAIYNHVVATVKYDKSGTGWGRGDIYYACDARRGNCTDFHAIFIGYCRAVGIPARFTIGFPLPADRGEGQVAGYHCWAEFYTKETGWVPVDASEAAKNPDKLEYFFGAHDENRVEFSRGRDVTLRPRQKGEPLNYFVYPYAEADGKPLTSIDKSFGYKDRASAPAHGAATARAR